LFEVYLFDIEVDGKKYKNYKGEKGGITLKILNWSSDLEFCAMLASSYIPYSPLSDKFVDCK